MTAGIIMWLSAAAFEIVMAYLLLIAKELD